MWAWYIDGRKKRMERDLYQSRNNNIRETISSKKTCCCSHYTFARCKWWVQINCRILPNCFFFLSFKTDISFHPEQGGVSSDSQGMFSKGECRNPRWQRLPEISMNQLGFLATLKTPSAELHILRSGNTSEFIWGFCKGYSDHTTG